MTKKLLLPTRQARRQVRHDLTLRPPPTPSRWEVAVAESNHHAVSTPPEHISEHNSSCERSENEMRLREWVADQRQQEACSQGTVREEEKTPPPVPPRPKDLLKRLHRPQKPGTEIVPLQGGDIAYPDLPPNPTLDSVHAYASPPSTTPRHTRDCTVLSEEQFVASPPPLPRRLYNSAPSPPTGQNHHLSSASASRAVPLLPPPASSFHCLPPTVDVIGTSLTASTGTHAWLSSIADSDLPNPSHVRTFTDASGKFKVHAELLDFTYGHVSLHKVNGVKIAVPLSKLSGEDIWWVLEEMESRRRPHTEAEESEEPDLGGGSEDIGERSAEVLGNDGQAVHDGPMAGSPVIARRQVLEV